MTEPHIVASPRDAAPFPVELVVFEEDTFLVLSAGNHARETRADTENLVADMTSFTPPAPGSLLIKGNRGYAVVHDLAQTPSFDPAWVDSVLENLAEHCASRDIRSIAVQPVGCIHGSLEIADFTQRLRSLPVERIWLMVDRDTVCADSG